MDEGPRWGYVGRVGRVRALGTRRPGKAISRPAAAVGSARRALLSVLPIYLNALGAAATWRGDFATAASLVAEGDAIAEGDGDPLGPLRGRIARRLSGGKKPRPPG